MQIFKDLADPQLHALLRDGAIGVLPTDTIYGLVCSAHNKAAVEKLYIIKPRELKPGTIVAASDEQLRDLGIADRHLQKVSNYWPNPLSVVLPVDPSLKYLHLGRDSLAVRIPAHKPFRKLLEQTGSLLTTSANLPDQPPARSLREAQAYFGDSLDFYVDGGAVDNAAASTIARLENDVLRILRPGAYTLQDEE